MKVIINPDFEYDLISADVCFMFGFPIVPELKPECLAVADTFLNVGDLVTRLGGDKTSAGFECIWFDKGNGLRYIGTHIGLKGDKAVMFEQVRNGSVINSGIGYKSLYFGYFIHDKFNWIFATRHRSGRVVETKNIEIVRGIE